MDAVTLTQLKDVAAIAGAVLSPLIGAATAVWAYKRQDRERLHAALIWRWAPDYQTSQPEEQPFLTVHNRSDKPVIDTEVAYLAGSIFPRQQRGTAMEYLDPTDLNFPYEIGPGKLHHFRLNADFAKALTDKATRLDRVLRKVGRSPIWVQARTLAKSRVRVGAEDATPWKGRAEWLG